MPQILSVSWSLVVTITTGMREVSGSFDSWRVAWKPLMPGMTTSMMMASGLSDLAFSMPSSPLSAVMVLKPFFSSHVFRTCTSVGESSMMSTVDIASSLRLFTARAPPDAFRKRSGRLPHVAVDRTHQFIFGKRLGQVLLGADDAAARAVEQAVLGGQHDHRRGLEVVVVLDERAGLVAIQARHHDVDEDDVGFVIGDLRERLEAVHGGHHLATFLGQERLSRLADGLAVVDHQDLEALQTAL